jgi:UDP-N-acetylglucosamine 2-epimerase (non-hydrolysing)
VFFRQLLIPAPDVNLNVGSGSHASQTAEIMRSVEPILLEQRPNIVLVVGDVNSTIAVSLTAAKLEIAIAHVEAGLRSFDREMPEGFNRILTDAFMDYMFITE